MTTPAVDQDRPPNFRDEDGQLYLVRCFNCDPENGRENWAVVVARGECAWCGWNRVALQRKRLFGSRRG